MKKKKESKPSDFLGIDLEKILGATEDAFVQQLTLFIPDKDQNGRKIKNISKWIRTAVDVLTIIGKGCTALPPADGTWLKNDTIKIIEELKSKDIVREKTTLISAYVYPERFENNCQLLRDFLHEFGRETNQGEVVVEFYGELYKISIFDPK